MRETKTIIESLDRIELFIKEETKERIIKHLLDSMIKWAQINNKEEYLKTIKEKKEKYLRIIGETNKEKPKINIKK